MYPARVLAVKTSYVVEPPFPDVLTLTELLDVERAPREYRTADITEHFGSVGVVNSQWSTDRVDRLVTGIQFATIRRLDRGHQIISGPYAVKRKQGLFCIEEEKRDSELKRRQQSIQFYLRTLVSVKHYLEMASNASAGIGRPMNMKQQARMKQTTINRKPPPMEHPKPVRKPKTVAPKDLDIADGRTGGLRQGSESPIDEYLPALEPENEGTLHVYSKTLPLEAYESPIADNDLDPPQTERNEQRNHLPIIQPPANGDNEDCQEIVELDEYIREGMDADLVAQDLLDAGYAVLIRRPTMREPAAVNEGLEPPAYVPLMQPPANGDDEEDDDDQEVVELDDYIREGIDPDLAARDLLEAGYAILVRQPRIEAEAPPAVNERDLGGDDGAAADFLSLH
ncbi:hypothetical protein R1sor_010946 [Riccia sorocarpa]|uniref:Uncharacterized protein n=1 Tax=Riccia sorocarpa TaxID=122646 RepID=A0ABD3HZH0_9MARC